MEKIGISASIRVLWPLCPIDRFFRDFLASFCEFGFEWEIDGFNLRSLAECLFSPLQFRLEIVNSSYLRTRRRSELAVKN